MWLLDFVLSNPNPGKQIASCVHIYVWVLNSAQIEMSVFVQFQIRLILSGLITE